MSPGTPTEEGIVVIKRIIHLKSLKMTLGQTGPFRTVRYSTDLESTMSASYYNLPSDHPNQRTVKDRILAMSDLTTVTVDPSLPENKMEVE